MIKSKVNTSTEAQSVEGMLTNKISMALNYEQIAQNFYVYKVTADSLKGENFKTVIANTYKLLSPLSLVKPASLRQYVNQFFILCRTPQNERGQCPNFTIKQIQSIHQESQISQHDLARLLIQAIPSLKQLNELDLDLNEGTIEESSYSYDLPASGGIGLYYLQNLEKIHKKTIIRSFEIDIKPLSFDHTQTVVTIKGVTFTPRSLHKKPDGSYPANIARLPSFNVLPFLNHVKKGREESKRQVSTINEDSSNQDWRFIKNKLSKELELVKAEYEKVLKIVTDPDFDEIVTMYEENQRLEKRLRNKQKVIDVLRLVVVKHQSSIADLEVEKSDLLSLLKDKDREIKQANKSLSKLSTQLEEVKNKMIVAKNESNHYENLFNNQILLNQRLTSEISHKDEQISSFLAVLDSDSDQ